MREMKDSGISWVGEIPQNWEMKRLKYLFKFCKGLPITKDNLIDQGLPVISYGQIHAKTNNGVDVRPHLLRFVDFSYQTFYPLSQVMRGDFVFADTSEDYDGCGNCVYKRNDSLLFAGYHTIIAHSIIESDNRFFAYLFLTDVWRRQIREKVSGVKVFSITQKTLSNSYIILPPLAEQQRIAEFLDRECGKIDGLKADIQAQIDTLEQYKRSVITEAVTHGLNPSAPMKDSGISWVGDIPQNWEIKRLKYLFKFCKGLPITKDNLIDQGLPVISYGQIHAKTNNGVDVRPHLLRFVDFSYQTFYPLSQVMRGDFVFADTSEDYEGCGNCVYKRNDSLLFAGYHTIIAHSIVESDNRFLAYLFQTDIWRKQIREKVSGVKVFSITQKTLSNTYLILPPLDEQQEIADYLDNKCAEIEQIIADKKSQIETLDGYKKSLIYEYVTGKKEVV